MRFCSFCDEPTEWAELLSDGRLRCAACKITRFFERELTLTGDYAGQPFVLMPWVRGVIRDIFGTLDDDGTRVYRDVYLEMPNGSSKTTICAGFVVALLGTAQGTGTEVYSAATTKEQASIVFRAAAQMIGANARLSSRMLVTPSTKTIVRRDDPTSFYKAISADGFAHDGLAPSFVVRDELHRWRTFRALELNEVLERKVMKRKNPLIIDITSAGDPDESPLCYRRHEYAIQIKEKVFQDPRFYGRIWAADSKRIEADPDYWKSKEARVAANPSHEDNGGYVRDKDLADLCRKAENDPHIRSDYLRYQLGYWGQQEDSVIDIVKWQQCGGGVDLRTWPTYDDELLIRDWGLVGEPCWAGVDASWTVDLTALALLFPPGKCEQWSVLLYYWMPEEKVAERERRDKVPYSEWVRRGFITSTPGNSVKLAAITDKIKWANGMFQLREMPFDPWNFKNTAEKLEKEEGITVVDIAQTFKMLSSPTKELLALYLDQRIRHGNNPVFNWNARCLRLQGDHKDNVQPSKPERSKSSKRIDGISATVTAMARALAAAPKKHSIYATRGLLTL
jgi:phage terminase large subunit-like protein